MFGGAAKEPVNGEIVIGNVEQLKVWHWILGKNVNIKEKFCNPFRLDRTPGCYLYYSKGYIKLADFADPKWHNTNIFDACILKYNISYYTALDTIMSKFVDKSKINLKPTKLTYITKKTKKLEKTTDLKINYNSKPFNYQDKLFWSKFNITSDNLKEDKVYSVDSFSINLNGGMNSKVYNRLCYCLNHFKSGRIKLYFPKPKKFFTNCIPEDIGFIERLDCTPDKNAFVCKSYKDGRININIGFNNTIYIQSESTLLPDYIIRDLAKCKIVWLFYDNDDAGRKYAEYHSELYNSICGIPNKFRPLHLSETSDNGEFIVKYNAHQLKNHILSKI